jgi:hypothetical protein
VLSEIGRAWREDRLKVVKSAAEIVDRLALLARGQDDRRIPGEDALTKTLNQFQQSFDTRRGGFGDAPKFPRPSELLFLLREYARTGNDAARAMVVQTLRAMALGGMRDHIGGGFHRYSVDGNWRVPHFEKMLYDQAQIVLACLEASQAGDDPFFAQIAEDTLQYVRRDMTGRARRLLFGRGCRQCTRRTCISWPRLRRACGGAQDGRRVLRLDRRRDSDRAWRRQRDLRGPLRRSRKWQCAVRSAARVRQQEPVVYGAIDRRSGKARDKSPIDVAESLLRARQVLFDARERKPRPQLDDKVLTAWNGLMIAAFARASRVLGGGALGQDNVPRPDGRASTECDRGGLVHPRCDVEREHPDTIAPLSRRKCGDRRLCRRLRLPDLWRAGAVPGVGRSRVAGMGPRSSSTPG